MTLGRGYLAVFTNVGQLLTRDPRQSADTLPV
jgi:hypothetical protein